MNYVVEAGQALAKLDSPFSVNDFNDNVFEAVKWLCRVYNESPTKTDEVTLQNLSEVFQLLPHVCNCKELLMALLEEINCFHSHEKFMALISPIKKCLQLMPMNFCSIVQAFDMLCAHLESVPLPKAPLDCVEKLEEDETYSKMRDIAKVFLDNFSHFVDELHLRFKQNTNDPIVQKSVDEFSLILLRVFARPLGYLFLDCRPESCEQLCLSLFEKLQNNALKYVLRTLEWKEKAAASRMNKRNVNSEVEEDACSDLEEDDETVPGYVEAGCGVLCYLVFRDTYSGELVPQVLSKSYLLEALMPVINHMIINSDLHLVYKGSNLLLNLLKNVGQRGLQPSTSESTALKTLTGSLVDVLTCCRVRDVIQTCVQCMNACLWALHPSDRLTYLSFVVRNSKSLSVQGFVVTAVKNQLLEIGPDEFDSEILNGLLRYVFSTGLPKAEKGFSSSSCIVDCMDRLMPTLNFLIYSIIRESNKPDDCKFCFSPIIQFACNNFLDPLKMEIESFRTQCLAEMEMLRRGGEICDIEPSAFGSVCVGDENLEPPTKEVKEEALKRMLVSLDLLESSVRRAESLLQNPEQKIQPTKAPAWTVAPSSAFEPVLARSKTNTRLAPFN